MVAFEWRSNSSRANRESNLDFPTAESPMITILKRYYSPSSPSPMLFFSFPGFLFFSADFFFLLSFFWFFPPPLQPSRIPTSLCSLLFFSRSPQSPPSSDHPRFFFLSFFFSYLLSILFFSGSPYLHSHPDLCFLRSFPLLPLPTLLPFFLLHVLISRIIPPYNFMVSEIFQVCVRIILCYLRFESSKKVGQQNC